MTMTNRKAKRHIEVGKPHWIEWATGFVSVLLVLALAGWLGREALMDTADTPELAVRIAEITRKGDHYVVQIELENSAPATAAAVRVAGTLTSPEGGEEVSETTFDYAPAESITKGGLLFRADPRAGRLDIRPTGYTEP